MSLTNPAPPGGFGVGAELTSSEANQICNQIPLALDKSVAGDTLSGVVTTAGAGSLQATTVGGMQSKVPGGIALVGGANDWVTFGVGGSVPRNKIRWKPFQFSALAPGWTCPNGVALVGPQTTTKQFFLLPEAHNGSTLTGVTFEFLWAAGVPAGQPANMPIFEVVRFPMGAGALFIQQSLGGGGQAPASLALTGAAQTFTYTCSGANAVIDATSNIYALTVIDQNGTNSGIMLYAGFQAFYSQIPNIAFP